jgi:hypothetical protein
MTTTLTDDDMRALRTAADMQGLAAEFAELERRADAGLSLVAIELERIAHEPPVNGNMLAQARLLLRVQQIRSGAA